MTYRLIKKPKVFYFELYKVLINIDICVEHPWRVAFIKKDYATRSIIALRNWFNILLEPYDVYSIIFL